MEVRLGKIGNKMINSGSKFRFLHQKGGGIVYALNKNGTYHVELDEGFFADVKSNEIVEIKTDFQTIGKVKNKDNKTNQNGNKSDLKNNLKLPTIDLHLKSKAENNQNFHPLEVQIANFKTWLFEQITKKQTAGVVIHGDGNGILRNEILQILKSNKNVKESKQANPFEHGTGATHIIFKYNL